MEERKFHPSPKKHYIRTLFMAVLVAAAVTYFRNYTQGYYNDILTTIFGFAAASCIIMTVDKMLTTLELEENSISVHRGIINTRSITIPYNKVTNATMRRGLLDRIVSTCTIEIDTAGTSLPEILINDVPVEKAKIIIEETKSKAAVKV